MAQNLNKNSINSLKEKISNRLDKVEGNYAVVYFNLDDESDHLFINEQEEFHAASTMKTPVMIEVFKQANEGRFNLDDSVIVKNEFKSIVDSSLFSMDIGEDSGEGLYKFIGKKKTIRDLVFEMITVSSNLATNILIDLVDAKNVMKTMKEIGAKNIKVLRGVEDIKAFDLGMNNTTTAYDLMLVFKAIANNQIVSKEVCEEMIDILLHQKFNERIPAGLPEEAKVAHKTGSITGVGHDSGIIFLPNGKKYILILLSKNVNEENEMTKAQAEVSKIIYDYVISQK
ncbi:MAG: serine hydrolase [Ignavibacteriaceae bacterium]